MVIAAHFLAAPGPGSSFFTSLNLLALKRPDDQFVFFIDDQVQKMIFPQENIKLVVVKPVVKNGLMLTYWYRFKLPKQLKKYVADIFLSDSGAFSPGTSIPQLAWIDDISFLEKKQSKNNVYSGFLRRSLPQLLKSAAKVIVPQSFLKTFLDKKFPAEVSRVSCLPIGLVDEYKPLQEETRQKFLELLTSGTEYFICEADMDSAANLTTMLKAFSLFKKRQKSSMKLVIVMHDIQLDQYVKDFHLYKYRADVLIKPFAGANEHARLIAAAYAGLYLPGIINKRNFVGLQILRSGAPLIVSDLPATRELFDEAVLYVDVNEKSIADHMMDLYKDEIKRKQTIDLGQELAKSYNWEANTDQLWQTILWHASYKAH